ncbi:MAG: HAMP domain-containing histidine kinase [Bacteroidia bacterium]|nr:HAMP domain-containing histidine kinase [Bacteroidia bacterium]
MTQVRRIRIIIIVMSVTLLALVGLQAYLIYRAYTQQSMQFDQSMREIMDGVKYKVERNHIENKVNQEFRIQEIEKAIRRNIDSMQVVNSGIEQPTMLPAQMSLYTGVSDSENSPALAENNPEMILDRFEGNLTMLRNNPGELRSIFNELIFGYLSYDERDFDTTFLRQEIAREISGRNIDARYEWGIYNSFNKSFIFATTLDNKGLVYSEYQVPLYYRGMKNAVMLSVYFPSQTTYLFGNVSLLLLSSLLITLIIIMLFVVSLRIIFEQKRVGEMKNDLMNNITHELKTPIATISLACQALADKDMSSIESIRENYIRIINAENLRLGKLVENILTSALTEKGEIKLKFKQVNLHERIQELSQSMKIQLEKRNVNLVLQLKAARPYLEADETHITNVVANLLDNAIKYLGSDNPEPRVVIQTYNKPGKIIFSIEDNGIGIPKADQGRIFDKLYRVSTGNVHNVKGYGLGLNYVKQIAEKHNGTIKVYSELGKGSTFTIELPFIQNVGKN